MVRQHACVFQNQKPQSVDGAKHLYMVTHFARPVQTSHRRRPQLPFLSPSTTTPSSLLYCSRIRDDGIWIHASSHRHRGSESPIAASWCVLCSPLSTVVKLVVLIFPEKEVGTSETHRMSIREPRDTGQAPPLAANQSTSFDLPQLVSQLEGVYCISFRHYAPILTTRRAPSINKIQRKRDSTRN